MKFYGALFRGFLSCVLVAGVEAALTQEDLWKLEDEILKSRVVVGSYIPDIGWVQTPKYFAQNNSETDQYTPLYSGENYKESLGIGLTGLPQFRHLVNVSMYLNGDRYEHSDTFVNVTDGWEIWNVSTEFPYGVHVKIRIEPLVGAFEMPSFRFKNHEFYILGKEEAVSFGALEYSLSSGGCGGFHGLTPIELSVPLGVEAIIRLKAQDADCSVAISEVNSGSPTDLYRSHYPFERVQGNRTAAFTIDTETHDGHIYLSIEMRRGNSWLVGTTIIKISVSAGLFLRIAKLNVGGAFAAFQYSTPEYGKIDVFYHNSDSCNGDVARIQLVGLRQEHKAEIRFASRGEAFNHWWVNMDSSAKDKKIYVSEFYNLPMNEYPHGVVVQIQIVENDGTPLAFFRTFMIVELAIGRAIFTTQLYYMKHHSVLYELDIDQDIVRYDYLKSSEFQLVVTCNGSATVEIASYQGTVLRKSGTNTQSFNLDAAGGIGYVKVIYFDPVTMFHWTRRIRIQPEHVKVISYYSVKYVSTGIRLQSTTDGSYLYTRNEINVVAVAEDSAFHAEIECSSDFRYLHSTTRGALTNVNFDTKGKEGFITISILDGESIIVRFKPVFHILPPGAFPDATPSPKPPGLPMKVTSRIPRRYSLLPRRLFSGTTSTSTYASSRIRTTTKITKTAPLITNLPQTWAAPTKLVETVDITTSSAAATSSAIRLRNITAVMNQAPVPQRFPGWIWPLILLGVCVILAGFFFYVSYKNRPTAPQPLVELSA